MSSPVLPQCRFQLLSIPYFPPPSHGAPSLPGAEHLLLITSALAALALPRMFRLQRRGEGSFNVLGCAGGSATCQRDRYPHENIGVGGFCFGWALRYSRLVLWSLPIATTHCVAHPRGTTFLSFTGCVFTTGYYRLCFSFFPFPFRVWVGIALTGAAHKKWLSPARPP